MRLYPNEKLLLLLIWTSSSSHRHLHLRSLCSLILATDDVMNTHDEIFGKNLRFSAWHRIAHSRSYSSQLYLLCLRWRSNLVTFSFLSTASSSLSVFPRAVQYLPFRAHLYTLKRRLSPHREKEISYWLTSLSQGKLRKEQMSCMRIFPVSYTVIYLYTNFVIEDILWQQKMSMRHLK